jgi:hypothetical protein
MCSEYSEKRRAKRRWGFAERKTKGWESMRFCMESRIIESQQLFRGDKNKVRKGGCHSGKRAWQIAEWKRTGDGHHSQL